jgi:two-component system nitrogen regulation response regulator GlnG
MSANLILLEDDESLRRVLSRALTGAGYHVRATASAETALAWIRNGKGDLLLADVLLDGANFLENLGLVSRLRPDMPVIVMSAQATATTAIDAEKGGVFEYLPKPFDLDVMIASVAAALGDGPRAHHRAVQGEPTGFIGKSAEIQATFRAIARAATSRAHVLITGEIGSGKRQAATALLSARNVNPDDANLITPSHSPEAIFASTSDGRPTVWLRLEDWSLAQQRAARDALETGSARVIATASPSESQPVEPRLWGRLGECVIDLPPLRARREDIPALCDAFLAEFGARDGHAALILSEDGQACLNAGSWPGNVVELRSVLSRLSLGVRGRKAMRNDVIAALGQAGDLAETGSIESEAEGLAARALSSGNARATAIDALDRALIDQALTRAGGNRSKAAEMLGLNRNTLARRLRELDRSD